MSSLSKGSLLPSSLSGDDDWEEEGRKCRSFCMMRGDGAADGLMGQKNEGDELKCCAMNESSIYNKTEHAGWAAYQLIDN